MTDRPIKAAGPPTTRSRSSPIGGARRGDGRGGARIADTHKRADAAREAGYAPVAVHPRSADRRPLAAAVQRITRATARFKAMRATTACRSAARALGSTAVWTYREPFRAAVAANQGPRRVLPGTGVDSIAEQEAVGSLSLRRVRARGSDSGSCIRCSG